MSSQATRKSTALRATTTTSMLAARRLKANQADPRGLRAAWGFR